MASMVTLHGDVAQLDSLAAQFAASQQQLLRAVQRGLRKLTRGVIARAASEIAAHNQLPVRKVRQRMFANRSQSNPWAYTVWFGAQPITAINLGTPRQTRRGVRVGKQFFDGAFIAKLASQRHVVKRSDEAVFAKGRDKKGRVRRGRLPIEVQAASIDFDHADRVLTREAEVGMRRELPRLLSAELNFELNVRGVAA